MKQVVESDRKLKDRHLLHEMVKELKESNERPNNTSLTANFGPVPFKVEHTAKILEEFGSISDTDYPKLIQNVEAESIQYIAGACGRKVIENGRRLNRCMDCSTKFLVNYGEKGLKDVDTYHDYLQRDGLVVANWPALVITAIGVTLIIELTSDELFKKKFLVDGNKFGHRTILETLIYTHSYEFTEEICRCGETADAVCKIFIKSLTNTLLSGLAKQLNNAELTTLQHESIKRAEAKKEREAAAALGQVVPSGSGAPKPTKAEKRKQLTLSKTT